MSYLDELVNAKDGVIATLKKKGVQSHYLEFGGEGNPPKNKPRVPNAKSEFLANIAMGKWAEKALAVAIRSTHPDWQATRYGNADEMAAGDKGFKEYYLAGLEEVRKFGKRPDLLIFPKDLNIADDLSSMPFLQAEAFVSQAIGALEVRSSKYEFLKYKTAREKELAAGKASGLETLNFTVKVEDLKIVYRWIERTAKPQAYVQVFLDIVFMINVLTIFRVIASGSGFKIKKHAKSQDKTTIMIPVDSGKEVGIFMPMPELNEAKKMRVTRLGRHDAYVAPSGGDLRIDAGIIEALLVG